MSKIAVVIIHGIGIHSRGYSSTLQKNIRRKLSDLLSKKTTDQNYDLFFEEILWGSHLAHYHQIPVGSSKLGKIFRIRWLKDSMKIRMHQTFDFIRSIKSPESEATWFIKTFSSKLSQLSLLTSRDAPLVIVSHSLGSIIAFQYIKYLQEIHYYNASASKIGTIEARILNLTMKSPLERGETLAGFYTLGSPIHALSEDIEQKLVPFVFPHPQFSAWLDSCPTSWTNITDRLDILGGEYSDAFLGEPNGTDIHEEKIWNGLTPYGAHTKYWKSSDVASSIAGHLADIIIDQ